MVEKKDQVCITGNRRKSGISKGVKVTKENYIFPTVMILVIHFK